jgi:hypothetical protein
VAEFLVRQMEPFFHPLDLNLMQVTTVLLTKLDDVDLVKLCDTLVLSLEIFSRPDHYCLLLLWRVARGSKLMRLELIHGLFIT